MPQGMEVGTLPGSIEKRNNSGLQIHFKPHHGRHDSGEDSRGSGGHFGYMGTQFRDKLRMKRNGLKGPSITRTLLSGTGLAAV